MTLPAIATMNDEVCVVLIRGMQLSEQAQRKPGGLLGVLNKACLSYKSGKGRGQPDDDLFARAQFAIWCSQLVCCICVWFSSRHCLHQPLCSYDVKQFVEKEADLLHLMFITLLQAW